MSKALQRFPTTLEQDAEQMVELQQQQEQLDKMEKTAATSSESMRAHARACSDLCNQRNCLVAVMSEKKVLRAFAELPRVCLPMFDTPLDEVKKLDTPYNWYVENAIVPLLAAEEMIARQRQQPHTQHLVQLLQKHQHQEQQQQEKNTKEKENAAKHVNSHAPAQSHAHASSTRPVTAACNTLPPRPASSASPGRTHTQKHTTPPHPHSATVKRSFSVASHSLYPVSRASLPPIVPVVAKKVLKPTTMEFPQQR